MSPIAAETREPVPYKGEAAIRVGVSAREQLQTRWGLILVIFMRLLATLWIVEGLAQWAQFVLPADEIFDHLSTGQAAGVIFFSVIDLLAAVGLWLATPWGGVLWLFAAISQTFVAFGVGRSFEGHGHDGQGHLVHGHRVFGGQGVADQMLGGHLVGGVRGAADVILILLYFALTWQAGKVSRAV